MSHFTVLVIGDDPESQLERYDENISVEEYSDGDVSDHEKKDFMEHYANEDGAKGLDFDAMYAMFGGRWNGHRWHKDDDNIWRSYTTYNPDSKWDWYSLGGRWTGYFKLKDKGVGITGCPGIMTKPADDGWVDQARICDIDFDVMSDKDEKDAGERYDKISNIIGPHLDTFKPWSMFVERIKNKEYDIDCAREMYHEQPLIKALEDADEHFVEIEKFICTRDEYTKRARRSAISTFAVVKDGEWYQKGEMGWWGMTSNEIDQDEWNKRFNELIDGLPENTVLSLYDCHI